jgi:Na+-driven multidrug efflux pump
MLLTGPIAPTLLRLAWPHVLVMLAQASTGLIETCWVSHLGTNALTGMALVFPGIMMMAMLSAGAVGARATGAARADADALVAHALLINLALGLVNLALRLATSALFLAFGRPLYAAMGGRGASLDAAMQCSNVVFAGNILVWLMNGLASIVRGTGNMLFPSMVICIGVSLPIPLAPLFIFGLGPMPGSPAAASRMTTALMAAMLAWHILPGDSVVRLSVTRLRRAFFADILRAGAVGSLSTLQP